MNEAKIKLKPCPFCGGESKVIGSDKYSDYCATCSKCWTTSNYFDSREKAAEAWNRRV
ncbi:MAG: Lar family restriction alleviation protein [Synergistaceae bacterium]|nr:Lar family restriction alleviation protein [Synergistaceae bacterium]